MTKSTPKTTAPKKPAPKTKVKATPAVTSKTQTKAKAKTKTQVNAKAQTKTRVTKRGKTPAVKAVAKKSVSSKTVAAAKKPTIRKPATLKKTIAPKKAITTQKAANTKPVVTPKVTPPKTVRKTTAKPKTSTVQKTLAKKSAAKTVSQSTKNDLHKTIASLEARMKRADTLTRKSVKALESAVMALDARTRKESSVGKAALTRKVNQLSAKLTDMVAQTQAEVNSELKTALNNPTVENLQAALFRADERLSVAEKTQASAISKVNRHLSAIATAVDARIADEAKARQAAIAALQTETQNNHNALASRIDTIEEDTAQALSRVGDKIAELSDELTQRGETSELSIREKVSEIALQTQAEFESYRAGLERRIDDVAQNPAHSDTQRLEHSIASLTARLEGLEYAVANPTSAELTSQQHAAPTAPQLSVVSSQPLPLATPQPLASTQTAMHETSLPDAFSPLSSLPDPQGMDLPNPYLTGQAEAATPPPQIKQDDHIPVEFDPRSYAARQESTSQSVDSPILTEGPLRDFTDTPPPPPPAGVKDLPPIGTTGQDMPYADPAYAEANPTMARVRIGGDGDTKFNLPKLTGRNLRVAAIATGVAVVGLVAAKGVFGDNDNPGTLPQQTAQQTAPQNNAAPVSIPKPDTSIAPIGDYADNKAVEVAPSSDAAKTLNSAAVAGDAVAQFQLGLSYLEQGRTDEGVSLIRKSANQNQPAAQYRLAKLYEIGEGVSQDSEMARQLTERAASNGNRIAMHDLALYYAEGRGGVEADLPTAAKWFEKAAERGVVDSQFNLGVLFESGQGLPKNMNDAFVWYSIAAAQGDQFAKTRIEVLTSTLDEADLVSATARVKKFKPRKIDEAANGIFRNVAWGKSADEPDEKVSQIKQVQTMLTELGYDIGGADGSVGPKTRTAIISFERANSLPETGRVNTALIDRLELATGA